MGTERSKPVNMFLNLVEKDVEFFNYLGVGKSQAMEIANERAGHYLEESEARIMLDGLPDVDFTERDTDGNYTFTLTAKEALLLSSIMFEMYLKRDIAFLRLKNVNYTARELTVFDPSNARRSFMEMFENIQKSNNDMLDTYKNTDRLTGQFKTFDFAAFDYTTES